MKTLYIDVYFFVNFTVDILAAFFAVKFSHIRTKFRNLFLISFLGSLSAIIDLFLPNVFIIHFFNTAIFLFFISCFISKKISLKRRYKFIILFLLSEMTVGGLVYFSYSFLDKYFSDVILGLKGGGENKKALIFSAIILLSIGVFRLSIMLFSNSENERSVILKLEIGRKCVKTEALVDSGNLAKDPMSMCPVIFIKEKFAHTFLPKDIVYLCDINKIDINFKKRIRLIPVTKFGITHVLTGIRVDRVTILENGLESEVDATVVIDKEGGNYGGYLALVPKLSY